MPERHIALLVDLIDEVTDERARVVRRALIQPVEEPVRPQRRRVRPVLALRQLARDAFVLLLDVLRLRDDLRQVGLPFFYSDRKSVV